MEIKIDSFNIFPLETAFDYRPGRQHLQVTNHVKPSRCATFDKVTNFKNLNSSNIPNLVYFRIGCMWQSVERFMNISSSLSFMN